MKMTKIIKVGRSQAVIIPREYRIPEGKVVINRLGDLLMLLPFSKRDAFINAVIDNVPPNFTADGRKQPKRAASSGPSTKSGSTSRKSKSK